MNLSKANASTSTKTAAVWRSVLAAVLSALLLISSGCRFDEAATEPKKADPPTISAKVELPAPKPYIPPPPPPPPTWADYDRAVRLHADGAFEEALSLSAKIFESGLAVEQAARLRFLAGTAAYQAGRFEEAVEYLAGDGAVPKPLAGWAIYYQGMAEFGAGRHDKARDILAAAIKANPGAVWSGSAALTRAWALYHSDKPKEAVEEAKKLVAKDSAGEVSLALGWMYEGLGDTGQAMVRFREAMDKSNMQEVRAEASLKYEQILIPQASAKGDGEAAMKLVRFLRQGWRLEEALAWIDKFEAEGRSTGALVGERALILYFLGRNEEALTYYQGRPGATNLRMTARILRRLGRWDEAAPAYAAAAKAFGSSASGLEAWFDAGATYLRADKPDRAEESFQQAGGLKGRRAVDILWEFGFHHYRAGRYDEAARRFKTIVAEHKKSRKNRQAEYWLGRALEKAGKVEAANEHYRNLAGSWKELYYRMLAERRLGMSAEVDHWPDLPLFRELLASPMPGLEYSFLPLLHNETTAKGTPYWCESDPGLSIGGLWDERQKLIALDTPANLPAGLAASFDRVKALAEVGAIDLAIREAEPLWYEIRKDARAASIELRLFAFLGSGQAFVGDYPAWVRLQYKNFDRLVSGRTDEQKVLAQRRFYPLAYPGPVLKAAEEFHLHPALVLSVIRTESYYEPGIMSVANARGLMQILPSTGLKISQRLGTGLPHPSSLFSPETNIRFGTWYLSALTREFDGQLPPAIASYNAGPFNVKRWVETAGDATLEEFIELIPFDQTNHYVKKILGDMYLHRLLFSGQPHCPDLTAPLRTVFRGEVDF